MIVDKFNDFFSKIGSNLSKHVSQTTSKNYRQFLNTTILTSFNFSLASELEVKKIIRALKTKTSSGHDGISVKLLKFLTPALIKPLTLIINQSLLSGIFPDLLKVAKVVPLFKKGDSLMVDNYRPISLLPSISKVFEKVVYVQLSEYFSKKQTFLCRSIWIQREALHRISNPRINGPNNLRSRSKIFTVINFYESL